MNGIQQWLQFFQNVSCFYRQMLMLPLWNKYPDHQNSIIDSLAIFLEGYVFERQGRRPDYFHVAVDSLLYCNRQNRFNAYCIWNRFRQSLNNRNLNHRNNPLYPSDNPDNIPNINHKLSVIEVVLNFQNSTTLSNHILDLITQNNDISQPFCFLKTIRGVGNKIASFYLRDLVTVLNVNLANLQNRWLLQPIDIWVERTTKTLANNQNMNKRQVANWIVTNCNQNNLNPEYVNMGIWFYCALIANSEYRLNQSLSNINLAQYLIQDYRSRIINVCQNCICI